MPQIPRTLLASALVCCHAAPATASLGDIRLGAEGGLATLAPPGQERWWGEYASAHLAVGLTDRLMLQAVIGIERGNNRDVERLRVRGVGVVFNIDVLTVTPALEVGMADFDVAWRHARFFDRQRRLAFIGASADWMFSERVSLGAIVRYAGLFESQVLSRPGYAAAQLRISLHLPVLRRERIPTPARSAR